MPAIPVLLHHAASRLQMAGIDSAALDARLLLQEALGRAREWLVAEADYIPAAQEQARFEQMLSRRLNREPVSHITGRREFWGMEFIVTPDVLDPRPDSETLVETVLLEIRKRTLETGDDFSIADLGTGSGCLLLSLLGELPQARGLGIDKSKPALAVARRNAEKLGLTARAAFTFGDWCATVPHQFDVVISNPPYIKTADLEILAPEVRRYEPALALDGGGDGLDCYRLITRSVAAWLKPQGLLAFEIGAGQEREVAQLLLVQGFGILARAQDLSGITRCILAQRP